MITCDKWVVIDVNDDKGQFQKVFCSTSGGYLSSDYWRLNSGVSKVEQDEDFYYVTSNSGQLYQLHKEMYGVAGLYNVGILDSIVEKFKDVATVLKQAPEEWKNAPAIETADR